MGESGMGWLIIVISDILPLFILSIIVLIVMNHSFPPFPTKHQCIYASLSSSHTILRTLQVCLQAGRFLWWFHDALGDLLASKDPKDGLRNPQLLPQLSGASRRFWGRHLSPDSPGGWRCNRGSGLKDVPVFVNGGYVGILNFWLMLNIAESIILRSHGFWMNDDKWW